jgi:hypothetical protein
MLPTNPPETPKTPMNKALHPMAMNNHRPKRRKHNPAARMVDKLRGPRRVPPNPRNPRSQPAAERRAGKTDPKLEAGAEAAAARKTLADAADLLHH